MCSRDGTAADAASLVASPWFCDVVSETHSVRSLLIACLIALSRSYVTIRARCAGIARPAGTAHAVARAW